MQSFADRLVQAIQACKTPCIVGLDPRLDRMPRFHVDRYRREYVDTSEAVRRCIVDYHHRVLDAVADLIPAVKPQSALFEQYGIPGLQALEDTIADARRRGLLVILDAKRHDIASTAQAYANAALGRTDIFDETHAILDADALTISPYLGSDSLEPFFTTCQQYGKGVFVLVKTSNPGSGDMQDRLVRTDDGEMPLYRAVAEMVRRYAEDALGASGYSSIGAVVGATYPEQARELRAAMPQSFFLVPGYGTQGGRGADVAPSFHADGLGAVVSASRSVTYNFDPVCIQEHELEALIRSKMLAMIADVRQGGKV